MVTVLGPVRAAAQLGDEAGADVDGVQRWLSTSGASTTNSSPPMRATVSIGRSDRDQLSGDPAQHGVARRVPPGVVDLLEPVEVDEEHRGAPAGALRAATAPGRCDRRAALRFGKPGAAHRGSPAWSAPPARPAGRPSARPGRGSSRAISRSCAFCALRSVNVRQMRSSPSTSSGELPDQDGDQRRRRCRGGRTRPSRRDQSGRVISSGRSGGRRR